MYLDTIVAPDNNSLIGDSSPADNQTFDKLSAEITLHHNAPRGANSSFAKLAALVMTTWMFPNIARNTILPTYTHAEFASVANTVLMGAIVKVCVVVYS